MMRETITRVLAVFRPDNISLKCRPSSKCKSSSKHKSSSKRQSSWKRHEHIPALDIGQPSFSWDRLPYELRERIFELLELDSGWFWESTSYFKWKGEVPALLIALELLPVSYEHALEFFGKCNSIFHLNIPYRCNINQMNAKELQTVTRLDIDLSEALYCMTKRQSGVGYQCKWQKPDLFTSTLLLATNLREINLRLTSEGESLSGYDYTRGSSHLGTIDFLSFHTEFPFWLEGCRGLSKFTVELSRQGWRVLETSRRRILKGMLERIYNKTGVWGRFEHDYYSTRLEPRYGMIESHRFFLGRKERYRHSIGTEKWVWEAPSGHFMDCTQGLGVRWKTVEEHLRERLWDFYEDASVRLELRDDGMFTLQDFLELLGRRDPWIS